MRGVAEAMSDRRSLSSKRRAVEHAGEAGRFFLVALAGLVIDIAIAWTLVAFAGATDAIATVIGFATATIANYIAHQFWTFRIGERRATALRLIGYVAVVIVTLAVRLLVLGLLGPILPGAGILAPVRFGAASAVSFVLSFVLSRLFVFRRPDRANA